MISFEEFQKMDIRVGKVLSAEKVEGADKLLKLEIDIGEKRQLVAGIAEYYDCKDIEGKQIVMLANLEPKTFRGIESQGMILAADVDGKAVVLQPDKDVPEGTKVS